MIKNSSQNSINNYKFIQMIGKGTFSNVFKATHIPSKKTVAVKIIKLGELSNVNRKRVLNEVRILASVSHKNVIEYLESFVDCYKNTFWIVTEYLYGGNLMEFIQEKRQMRVYISER